MRPTARQPLIVAASLSIMACQLLEPEMEKTPAESDRVTGATNSKHSPQVDSLCDPGTRKKCACTGGQSGSKLCASNGESWTECKCEVSTDKGSPFVLGGELSREFAATGLLVFANGSCTATLVAPNMILTAAHCLHESRAQEAEFMIGVDAQSPVRTVALAQIFVHPDFDINALEESGHDLAVARLRESINEIAPVVLHLGDASELVGERMRLTGFGSEGLDPISMRDVGGGVRRSASVTVSAVTPETLVYTFQGMGACHGDSGGPAFVDFGGSFAQVGVTSWGDPACVMMGRYQRLDVHRDWLESVGVRTSSRKVSCDEDKACDGQCQIDQDCLALLCPQGSCTAPAGMCTADGSCDERCGSADPDCADVEPELDPCEAYGLNDNGVCNPQCPEDLDCAPTDMVSGSQSCVPVHMRPEDDGLCYYLSSSGAVCGTVPLQALYYDPSSSNCVLFDASGQACGFAPATAFLDQQGQCNYVDPAGNICGQRWATCTSAGCFC